MSARRSDNDSTSSPQARPPNGTRLQLAVGYAVSPLVAAAVLLWLRCLRRYRIRNLKQARGRIRELLAKAQGPVLVCANHLTWVDSLLVQAVLTSFARVLRAPNEFAWNLPDQTRARSSRSATLLAYLCKCLPIPRGRDREQQRQVINKAVWLLERGELVMAFPEGRRSRTGRVDGEDLAHGVGRIVKAVDGCQVLCVYLRGERQEGQSLMPEAAQSFDVDIELFRPTSSKTGLSASRDIAQQIVDRLAKQERRYFARGQ